MAEDKSKKAIHSQLMYNFSETAMAEAFHYERHWGGAIRLLADSAFNETVFGAHLMVFLGLIGYRKQLMCSV